MGGVSFLNIKSKENILSLVRSSVLSLHAGHQLGSSGYIKHSNGFSGYVSCVDKYIFTAVLNVCRASPLRGCCEGYRRVGMSTTFDCDVPLSESQACISLVHKANAIN